MVLRMTKVEVVGPTELSVTFNDGTSGVADVGPRLVGPVFEPLHDPERFAEATLDPICGTVVWPNGADFAPEAVRDLVATPAGSQV